MLSEAVARAISNIINEEVDCDLIKSLEDGVVCIQFSNSCIVSLHVLWEVISSWKIRKMAQKSQYMIYSLVIYRV